MLTVPVHEDEARNSQQVEKMDAYGYAYDEGYEDYPTVRMRLVRTVVPFGHGPEDQGGRERRHGIDLGLYCAEPEGVGEAVGKGSYGSGSPDGNGLAKVVGSVLRRLHHLLGKEDDGQVEEEYRKARAEGAHDVHGDGGMLRIRKHSEESREQLEGRVPRRMTDFELIGRCDELAAVPERCGRLDCRYIGKAGDGQNDCSYYPVPQVELSFLHNSILIHRPPGGSAGML